MTQAPAQPVKLEHFGEEQGISGQLCGRLLQDKKGFLWIASSDCLLRYDGVQMKSYPKSTNDSVGISDSQVRFLTGDKKGNIWAITYKDRLFRYDEAIDNFRPFPLKFKPDEGVNNRLDCLLEDQWGVCWVLFNKLGVGRLDTETGEVTKFLTEQGGIKGGVTMKEDAAGNIWIVSTDLFCIMPPSGQDGKRHFRRYALQENDDFPLYIIEPGKNGLIWLGGYGDKVYAFDPKTGTSTSYQYVNPEQAKLNPHLRINRIREDSRGNIWLAVNDGVLVLINPALGKATELVTYQENSHGLPPKNISDVLEDNSGQIWISSWGNGLYRYSPQAAQFGLVGSIPGNPQTLGNPTVTALTETSDGMIWAGTLNGLNRFDPKTKTVKRFPVPNIDNDERWNEIMGLVETRSSDNLPAGLLWVATVKGLKLFNPQNGQFTNWRSKGPDDMALENQLVYNIVRTADGRLFVDCKTKETPHAVFLLDGLQQRFRQLQLPKEYQTFKWFYVDASANFWIHSDAGSMMGYNMDSQKISHLYIAEESRKVFSMLTNPRIHTASDGRHWIHSDNGLFLMTETDAPNTFRLRSFGVEEGLPNNFIKNFLEDSNGNFWISTNAGISCFNPRLQSFKNYSTTDGIQGKEFNLYAGFKSTSTGYLYFGGSKGFNYFHPDSLNTDRVAPPVAITSIHVLRNNVMERLIPTPAESGRLPSIEINYDEHVINIKFAALHFANPRQNQYAYRLEGFDKDWRHVGNEHEATYTNLDPGTYRFRVKAANRDGVWNETGAGLIIRVLPPWWKTWWAYLGYALLLGGVAYGIFSFLKKRWKLQNDLKLEQAEANRLKELDHFKTRLYTNLTHEFRTPLTVILGMIGQIRSEPKKHLDEGARLIETNGENLLRLINQLLDLSKLENKSFQLRLQQGDMVPYLRYVTESFQSYANQKNLSLRFFSTLESLEMDYDPEQIKQVLTNLISNAVKFTPSGGEVQVSVKANQILGASDPQIHISVTDTGIGILEKDLPYIFDRFYQVDSSHTREGEGTGIGLAHTQELVKVMGGEIGVESELGTGSSFWVRLPVTNHAPVTERPASSNAANPPQNLPQVGAMLHSTPTVPSRQAFVAHHSSLPQLLIIEDNPDVVVYLKSCLEGLYQLDVAYNGEIGIEKALENIPDLIISDVMMPGKDGYQVCDLLKNDERTSHIPIILLTAKADAASKLTGLKRGADAYLTKPFDKEELLVRLEMLVERQKRMAAYFSQNLHAGAGAISNETEEAIQIEDAFMKKVRQIVEENYGDENFALPELCKKIGMSRSQLFRKMQAVSNTSPSDFIRSYRLNKAKTLLETADFTVSEVAWQVGYKDLAHFSKSYLETFGVLPSLVRK